MSTFLPRLALCGLLVTAPLPAFAQDLDTGAALRALTAEVQALRARLEAVEGQPSTRAHSAMVFAVKMSGGRFIEMK